MSENTRIARVVDPVAVFELDHEAGRVAEIEGRLARGVPVARRMVGRDHRDLQAGRLDGAALVEADDGVGTARQAATEPQAHLVHARPHGPQATREGDGVAHVIEVAVRHEQHVALLDGIGRDRAPRVREERIDDHGLAAGGIDPDHGMAVPGDRRAIGERHGAPPSGRRCRC